MTEPKNTPRLYDDLASWWPLLSTPEDYAEETAIYRKTIVSASSIYPQTLLELGSGGGNNASHLKVHFTITLVDISNGMLTVSRSLNPECEHIQGDMRDVRLNRLFDAVFIHDAIVYMTTEKDLRSAIETAAVHCEPGGVCLFCPDHIRETFRPSTGHGGHDGADRSMRYLEWTWDPDPTDTTYITDFAYLLRDDTGVRCEHDRHHTGLFGRNDWLRFITEAGLRAQSIPFELSTLEPGTTEIFLGVKSIADKDSNSL
ncbi:MAG: class I SAM-dependent methyltransferase [Dehalococcoidales bacterium]|nr:MAG: class I SAM-dependent methyltransferase [Dehalococcoidales bacterium]